MFKPPMRLEKWIAFDGDVPAELAAAFEPDADSDPENDSRDNGDSAADDVSDAGTHDMEIGGFVPFSIEAFAVDSTTGSVVTDEGRIDIGYSPEFAYSDDSDLTIPFASFGDDTDSDNYFSCDPGVNAGDIFFEITGPAGGKFVVMWDITQKDDFYASNLPPGIYALYEKTKSEASVHDDTLHLFDKEGSYYGQAQFAYLEDGGVRFHLTGGEYDASSVAAIMHSLKFVANEGAESGPVGGYSINLYYQQGTSGDWRLFHDGKTGQTYGMYNPDNDKSIWIVEGESGGAVPGNEIPDPGETDPGGNTEDPGDPGTDEPGPDVPEPGDPEPNPDPAEPETPGVPDPVIPPPPPSDAGPGDVGGEPGGMPPGGEPGIDAGDSGPGGGDGDSGGEGGPGGGDDMMYIYRREDDSSGDDDAQGNGMQGERAAVVEVEVVPLEERAVDSAAVAAVVELARDVEVLLSAVREEREVLLQSLTALQVEYLRRGSGGWSAELREVMRDLFAMGNRETGAVNRVIAEMHRQMDVLRGFAADRRDGMLTESLRELMDGAQRRTGEASALSQAFEAVLKFLRERDDEGGRPDGREVLALFERTHSEALRKWGEKMARLDPMGRELAAAERGEGGK